MRKMILCFMILPLLTKAQSPESLNAFHKSIPADLGKPVRFPEQCRPDHSIEYIADYNVKSRIHIISSDSAYRKIFWHYRFTKDSIKHYNLKKDSWNYKWMMEHLSDSLPVIDFNKQELVMYSACGQCLAFCDHEEGSESCHRNACNFMYAWFVRDKKYNVLNETGERRNFLDALYGYKPDSSAKPVSLPFAHHTDFHKYFEVGRKSSYLLQLSDSVYRGVFAWYIERSDREMPVIDFSRQELWVRIVCHQCLMFFADPAGGWNNRSCHRNVCRYSYAWYLQDKRSIRD